MRSTVTCSNPCRRNRSSATCSTRARSCSRWLLRMLDLDLAASAARTAASFIADRLGLHGLVENPSGQRPVGTPDDDPHAGQLPLRFLTAGVVRERGGVHAVTLEEAHDEIGLR